VWVRRTARGSRWWSGTPGKGVSDIGQPFSRHS
jgi:hypothetical protein